MQYSDYYEDQSVLPEKVLSLDEIFLFNSEDKKHVLTNCKVNKKNNTDCEGQTYYNYDTSSVDYPFLPKNIGPIRYNQQSEDENYVK